MAGGEAREATCIRIFAGRLAVRECPGASRREMDAFGWLGRVRQVTPRRVGQRFSRCYWFQLLPHVRVGGEVTSDTEPRSFNEYTPPRLDRPDGVLPLHARSIAGHDKGVSGGLALGRGVAVSGAMRVSDAASDSSQWQLASIRLPLRGRPASRWNGRGGPGRPTTARPTP